MPLRLASALAVMVLILAACGGDDLLEGSSTTAASTTASAETTGQTATDDEPTATVLSGPTTTFVPPLTGPFDLGGGATSPTTDDGVIVDPDAVAALPPTLAQLTWETDWTRRTVEDWTEFGAGLGGSDPRDGIPPIDSPIFESVALASEWLSPREPGALVQLDGEARFYPLGILTRHEIVNDAFGDVPVAVTFCPLCNTALAFDRRIDGEVLRFGVSGLLRNSDLVMWDSTTTSLWQQITGEGVVGRYAGSQLNLISTSIVSFEQFASSFPEGKSLAAESASGRDVYGVNPYRGYSSSQRPFLFSGDVDDRFPALSRVVGVDEGDALKAYPFELLAEATVVNDTVGDTAVVVWLGGDTADALDAGSIAESQTIGTALALDPVVDGETLTFAAGPATDTFVDEQTGSTWSLLGRATSGPLEGSQLGSISHRNEFWFAWQAFFPEADVFEA